MKKFSIYIVLAIISITFFQCNPDSTKGGASIQDNGTEVTIVEEPEDIKGQPVTVKGTIKDAGTSTNSTITNSSAIGTAAGTITVS